MLYDYKLFVLKKAAPPRDILEEHFNLNHAALGIATEYMELILSFERHNTEEELGDLLFFLVLAGHSVNYPIGELPTELPIREQPNLSIRNLGGMVETFVSLVKKHIYYDNDQSELLVKAYRGLWDSFIFHLQACNFPFDICVATNQAKLNQRYQDTFSQEEAAERKDKV